MGGRACQVELKTVGLPLMDGSPGNPRATPRIKNPSPQPAARASVAGNRLVPGRTDWGRSGFREVVRHFFNGDGVLPETSGERSKLHVNSHRKSIDHRAAIPVVPGVYHNLIVN
jgi:hypothetical protein